MCVSLSLNLLTRLTPVFIVPLHRTKIDAFLVTLIYRPAGGPPGVTSGFTTPVPEGRTGAGGSACFIGRVFLQPIISPLYHAPALYFE